MFGIANKNYEKKIKFIFGSTVFKLENIKLCYWAMSKICKGGRGKNMLPYFRSYLLCGIDGFCSTTKYTPFMIGSGNPTSPLGDWL